MEKSYKDTGIIQPRVGINLDESRKSIFAEIFGGSGGVDSYTNAISDTYQDNFDEGIYTGKGIYDLGVFYDVMKDKIPENTVLSHDLLEGSYLRCGLASDIMLLDGYPKTYLSFLARMSRWIRGDYQIAGWLAKKELNKLSKFKIIDNIRRSLLEITTLLSLIILLAFKAFTGTKIIFPAIILILSITVPSVLEMLNYIIFRKENIKKQRRFTKSIDGLEASFYRAVLNIMTLPTKAYVSLDAIVRTIYRMSVSRENLLEWTTSAEAEVLNKNKLTNVIIKMLINVIIGAVLILFGIFVKLEVCEKVFIYILSALFLIAPLVMWHISKERETISKCAKLIEEEKDYIIKVAEKTWGYFAEFMNKENSYLPPDNYQESRREKIVDRTSSTNIGLRCINSYICI